MCAFHDDTILDLGVAYGGVVSDAGVGTYVGVGAYIAVVSDDGGSPDCGSTVNYRAFAYSDIVGYRRGLLDCSLVIGI